MRKFIQNLIYSIKHKYLPHKSTKVNDYIQIIKTFRPFSVMKAEIERGMCYYCVLRLNGPIYPQYSIVPKLV